LVNMLDGARVALKIAQGKYFESVLDAISLFYYKKENSFEDIFKNTVRQSFEDHKKLLINNALHTHRITSEQSTEYENCKLDIESLIKRLKQNNQWSNIGKLVFNEDDFEDILYPYIKESLGVLEGLMSDSSDESAKQISKNISKQTKNLFISEIEANQPLFNECLMDKLNVIGSNVEEILEEVKKALKVLGIEKLNMDSIKSMLTEFMKKNSKEHEAILKNNEKDHAAQNRELDQIKEQIVQVKKSVASFDNFLHGLQNKLESKNWPSDLREIVLSKIYYILKEFRDMGEEKTRSFLQTVLLDIFSKNKIIFNLTDYIESSVKIVQCIALIRIIYPGLTLSNKTAKSLDIDGCRSICLLYSDYSLYKRTIMELWKYVKNYQPELKGVFRVIVGNQTCRFCYNKKGADFKALGLENCLADFMRVMLADGSKPEYNDLQVDFERIVFHCQECLGSYELADNFNFNEYKRTLCSIFGEEE